MGILQRWHSELQDVAPLPITYVVSAQLSYPTTPVPKSMYIV